jgi:hypothetical protein
MFFRISRDQLDAAALPRGDAVQGKRGGTGNHSVRAGCIEIGADQLEKFQRLSWDGSQGRRLYGCIRLGFCPDPESASNVLPVQIAGPSRRDELMLRRRQANAVSLCGSI